MHHELFITYTDGRRDTKRCSERYGRSCLAAAASDETVRRMVLYRCDPDRRVAHDGVFERLPEWDAFNPLLPKRQLPYCAGRPEDGCSEY